MSDRIFNAVVGIMAGLFGGLLLATWIIWSITP